MKPAPLPNLSKRYYRFWLRAAASTLLVAGGSALAPLVYAQSNLETLRPVEEEATAWTREQAARIEPTEANTAPYISDFEVIPPDIDVWVWDSWPLRNRDSSIAQVGGYYVLFALVAPRDLLPEERHDVAEIGYFYSQDGQNWTYGGTAFPDGEALGSRQWAGSALVDDGQLYLFYTAVGRQVEPEITFEQRLALSSATIRTDASGVYFEAWTPHQVLLEPEGVYYQTEHQSLYEPYGASEENPRDSQFAAEPPEEGSGTTENTDAENDNSSNLESAEAEAEEPADDQAPGKDADQTEAETNPILADLEPADIDIIYSFRDPWFFTDPADDQSYLLFVANTPGLPSETVCPGLSDADAPALAIPEDVAVRFNGSIGLAVAPDPDNLYAWETLPPIMDAVCVNQQLERPHILVQDDLYYLFFSTHDFTFVPDLEGIEGLFGFVADSMQGDYVPLNGDGLVLTNPPEAPFQTFSWVVLPDRKILSFINYVDLQQIDDIQEQPEDLQREKFGGTFAPIYEIVIEGQETRLDRVLGQGVVVDSPALQSTLDN